MKTFHKYIIKSFLGPFVLTFCISLFVLLMQFLWKYIDDFVGKGLEWYIVVELLTYASANLIPMALPLAMLISSIMTFGNLGENYELVAIKSAGVSLGRIISPLVVVTLGICFGAFYFSNNLLPIANLKFGALLYDITHQKPAIDIKEGIFYNGIDGYSIRIEKKEENGTLLKNIIIYDHTQRIGNSKVLVAESGRMNITSNKEFMILNLKNGHNYEELKSSGRGPKTFGFNRTHFKEETLQIGLSDFNLTRTDQDLFKDHYAMLNLRQLNNAVKEIKEENIQKKQDYFKLFANSFYIKRKEYNPSDVPLNFSGKMLYFDSLLIKKTKPQLMQIFDASINLARNSKSQIESFLDLKDSRTKYENKHLVEWHKKFTLSFACMILFFIGAPLGAIIRKGGLGMPLVVSVILFIFFHVLSTTGEKMVKEAVVTPWVGMWMATAILLPLGIYLTIIATKDSNLMDLSIYTDFFKKLTRKKKQKLTSIT